MSKIAAVATKNTDPLPPHPIQPLVMVDDVQRFRANKVVRYLLDHGGIDLNKIAMLDFPREDQEQFAQLIGYSLSGFADLPYASDEVYVAAQKMADGMKERDGRIQALRYQLDKARKGMREGVAALYGIHPDDLTDRG